MTKLAKRGGNPLHDLSDGEVLMRLLAQKSKKTAENYERDFRAFGEFCGMPATAALRHFLDLQGFEANDLMLRWVDHLKKQGLASNTVARRVNAMRSICRTGRMLGWIDWSIEIPGVKTKRVRQIQAARAEQFEQLVAVIEAERDRLWEEGTGRARARAGACIRDLALVVLLRGSGCRRAEALSLDWPEHVDTAAARVLVLPKGSDEVREWRSCGGDAISAIADYLSDVRGRDPGPLFQSVWGSAQGRLDLSQVNKRLNHYGELAGLKISPHMFRHGAVTDLLDETGGDVEKVKNWIGHKNISTTLGYSHRDSDRRKMAEGLTKRGRK